MLENTYKIVSFVAQFFKKVTLIYFPKTKQNNMMCGDYPKPENA